MLHPRAFRGFALPASASNTPATTPWQALLASCFSPCPNRGSHMMRPLSSTLCGTTTSIGSGARDSALRAAGLPHRTRLGRCHRAPPPPPRASLFTSVAETVTLAAAVGGITLSALPLLTGEARERNAERPFNEETREEDFVFGVMSAVGFLPYVNWTSWVFKAFNTDDPAFYYGMAAVYGLPWVFHDLRLDGFTGLLLTLGSIHVQVERTAATEPVQVTVPGLSQLAAQLRDSIAKPASEVAQAARRKQLSAGQRRPLPGEEEADDEDPDKVLLDRWDDIFKNRDKERRQ